MRRTSILLLSLAALFFTPSATEACTCMAGIPTCESVWTSDAVFSGEVLSVEPFTNPNGEGFSPHRKVRLRVIESWRGDVSGVVEVKTGSGGGDCGYSFLTGMTYLVYAHSRGGALSTGICSRTRPLSQAAEDVAYLKTALTPSAAGRIFGTVQYQRQWDPAGGRTPERLIAGYPVTLSDGKRTWKAVTDKSGRFEFTVPAGTYTVTVTTPETERGHGPRNVTLADPRGCAAADFYVIPDGRIRVRVLESGLPRADITVEIIDLEAATQDRPLAAIRTAVTNTDGHAEFSELHPKRYALAINATRMPNEKAPYPSTFFTNGHSVRTARTIELGVGERLELGDWPLPPALEPVRVEGQVLLPDGSPASGARVAARSARNTPWSGRSAEGMTPVTDENGRFTLTLFKGIEYEVSAYRNESQPAVQRRQWSSPPITVKAETAETKLRLELKPPPGR